MKPSYTDFDRVKCIASTENQKDLFFQSYSTYCYKHLYYQKQILQEHSNLLYQQFGLVFSDCFWFSVDAIHFTQSKSV